MEYLFLLVGNEYKDCISVMLVLVAVMARCEALSCCKNVTISSTFRSPCTVGLLYGPLVVGPAYSSADTLL